MAEKLAIHVRNLTKHFGEGHTRIQVLKEVDFDTKVGELMMIMGPSGSGKTTLLSVIAGTLRADSGEIDVFNSEIHKMNEKEKTEFRRKNVGFIFQQFNLIPTIDILDNVIVPLLLNGISLKEARKKGMAILETVGLKDRFKERPSKLSGGEQQRVAVARALIHEPKLIICDEPTSQLDAMRGAEIMELVADLAKRENRCGVVVTHDPRIMSYADRVAKMEDGVVISIDSSQKG